ADSACTSGKISYARKMLKTKRTNCLKKDLIGMRVFPTLSPFIYPHYKNMKKNPCLHSHLQPCPPLR
ncbi:hypothetical protein DD202_12265, partial [Neisseria gonorrhoeae]